MIPFNKPYITKEEEKYVLDAITRKHLSGDGYYTKQVSTFFKDKFNLSNLILTTSGTDALEMASILLELEPEDEVIVPSFTFSSTVNAPMLSGAKPVFVDVREDTLNIDENKIREHISAKTKAIYVVHYGGIPCEMDKILSIAKEYKLEVIEDAAQAVGSFYKGRPCGSLSALGCYSFHETKNFSMGEGGALIVNDSSYLKRADIIREKGTDRRNMLRGLVDKYTWQDIGSSFLPSDILAALLYGQLMRYDQIYEKRLALWNQYHTYLEPLEKKGLLRRPILPQDVTHNGHLYYILLNSNKEREDMARYLKEQGIMAVIHYVPLHSSPFGQKLGYKKEDCPITQDIASRLLRLPLYAQLSFDEIKEVTDKIANYWR